jgi:zinc/manganese transport system permease protein
MDFLQLMAAPFAACIVLTGIHAYLGLHVIEREVIFVDLALAQIAAFGATVGFLWGLELHSTGSYFVALGFTFVGAAIFSLTRFRRPVVPH